MKKSSSEEMQESILKLNYQISQLKKNADKSEVTSKLYNRLLIERAILRKKTNSKKPKRIIDILKEKFSSKSKEKCISDYFKSPVN
jgi:hypothetical protein